MVKELSIFRKLVLDEIWFKSLNVLANHSIYFSRRVTAGWSQQKTIRVIKFCCTNGIQLQIKTQNNFKLKHRYLIVVQAGLHKKHKKNAGNLSIWQNKMHASLWETILN